jgi:hypothetical protein
MKLRRAGFAALLAALAGCGGGSSTGSGSDQAALSGALVHSAFVDRADRICTEGRKRLILTGNRYFGDLATEQKPSDAAVTAFARREAIPILSHQYAKLRGLTPPPGDERAIGRILDLADAGIRQLQADPTLLNRGSGIPPALERARHRAYLYGLGACGQAIEPRTASAESGGAS